MGGADCIQLGAPHAPVAHIGMKKDYGSAAAYDLCLVAEGVFDAFWEKNLKKIKKL